MKNNEAGSHLNLSILQESADQILDAIKLWTSDDKQVEIFKNLVIAVLSTLNSSRKLIFFGNGGSAAEASHMAAEFIGKCEKEIGPHAAISLNDSNVSLTAISNDWNFQDVFSRQITAIGYSGDLAIGLSTSGNSENVTRGLEAAKKIGLQTSLWTSSKIKKDLKYVDYLVQVPATRTPRIQEVHLFIGHLLCEYVEKYID
jgi:D-sedoheptulose 7-phosphate isomerase